MLGGDERTACPLCAFAAPLTAAGCGASTERRQRFAARRRLTVRPLRGRRPRLPMPGADLSSVGVSGRAGAKSDVAVCEGVPAAIAVLSEAGSVERATRAF